MKKIILLFFAFSLFFTNSYAFEYLLGKDYLNTVSKIQALNLINGLNLTKKQIKVIISSNIKLKKFISLNKQDLKDIVKQYKKFEVQLINNGFSLNKEYFKNIENLHQKETAIKSNLSNLYNELVDVIKSNLSDAQKIVISNYNPCIIPPDEIKNPIRTGQGTTENKFVKILEVSRKIPDLLLNPAFELFWNKLKVHLNIIHQGDKKKINMEKNKLWNIILKARKMNETDFQLNKVSLASKITPEYPLIYNLIKKNKNWGINFLLNPELIEYYKIILKRNI